MVRCLKNFLSFNFLQVRKIINCKTKIQERCNINACKIQYIGTSRMWALRVQKSGQSVKKAKAQISTSQFKDTFAHKVPMSIKKAFAPGLCTHSFFEKNGLWFAQWVNHGQYSTEYVCIKPGTNAFVMHIDTLRAFELSRGHLCLDGFDNFSGFLH